MARAKGILDSGNTRRADGLTEAEMSEASAWVANHRRSGLSGCERFDDYRGYHYLSVRDERGSEVFILGRQHGKFFADQLWTLSTLAEGDSIAAVLSALEDIYRRSHDWNASGCTRIPQKSGRNSAVSKIRNDGLNGKLDDSRAKLA